ncbi:substrate-binding domain-containing protein [Pseudarthrobacter sp. J64]|uniref:substrate-binding domain-containing protein n=1 Tax=Pseudarthrobacter sp. J64 TaxID=3116485 RepID=UPI002E80BCD8|nr:substrate-binding domain-containing protein [Pseudarthrobacter sp. J64]MEE2569143.1 substrate-binding domain-containing protein [Pseudarthrobacter sp. J64]
MARSVTERRQAILEIVQQEGPQVVLELAQRLNISAVTIRRDLEELAGQGLVHRTHGAVAPVSEHAAAVSDGPKTIGLVVPHSNYYFDGVIAGAKAAAAAAGARLVLGVSDYDKATEMHQVARLTNKGVDGLVVAPTPDFVTGELDAEQQEWLVSLSVPVVLVERQVSSTGAAAILDSVSSAHSAGAALAIRHLSQLGHRKLACVMIAGPNAPQVRSGYLSAVESLGLESLGVIDEGGAGSEDAAELLLQAVREGATGIFVHNDQLAVRCMMWLEDAGVSVPDQVSLAGYDDVIAGVAHVPLTAVAPWKSAVGHRAVQRLLTRIAERASAAGSGRPPAETMATEHLEFIPRLHVRQSTTKPYVGGPMAELGVAPSMSGRSA